MMFVAEQLILESLNNYTDTKLDSIIKERLVNFSQLNTKRDGYEPLGFKIKNDKWQKLAYFAVRYHTSIAKVASCLFEYARTNYELRTVLDRDGLTIKKKKEKVKGPRSILDKRLSDY